jgi:hypothetical protein
VKPKLHTVQTFLSSTVIDLKHLLLSLATKVVSMERISPKPASFIVYSKAPDVMASCTMVLSISTLA